MNATTPTASEPRIISLPKQAAIIRLLKTGAPIDVVAEALLCDPAVVEFTQAHDSEFAKYARSSHALAKIDCFRRTAVAAEDPKYWRANVALFKMIQEGSAPPAAKSKTPRATFDQSPAWSNQSPMSDIEAPAEQEAQGIDEFIQDLHEGIPPEYHAQLEKNAKRQFAYTNAIVHDLPFDELMQIDSPTPSATDLESQISNLESPLPPTPQHSDETTHAISATSESDPGNSTQASQILVPEPTENSTNQSDIIRPDTTAIPTPVTPSMLAPTTEPGESPPHYATSP